MDAVAALFHGWLVVLAVAGATKLVDPATALAAVGSLGVRPGDVAGRAIGLLELGVAAVALAWGGRGPAAAVVVVTGGIAVVALALFLSPVTVPCGCIGRRDTTVGAVHVAVVVGAVIVSVGAVVRGAADVVDALDAPVTQAVSHLAIALGAVAVTVAGLAGRPGTAPGAAPGQDPRAGTVR